MRFLPILSAISLTLLAACSQGAAEEEDQGPLSSATFEGMALRNIGPALMSGRIADIQIVQDDPATWYVAVGSGGVWKTTNAGTSWTPIGSARRRAGRLPDQSSLN